MGGQSVNFKIVKTPLDYRKDYGIIGLDGNMSTTMLINRTRPKLQGRKLNRYVWGIVKEKN